MFWSGTVGFCCGCLFCLILKGFLNLIFQFTVLLFSCWATSDSLWAHGRQHTRVCSDSCLLSQWCHTTISSSVTQFSCPQCFPASLSFPMSQLFVLGGQSNRASASALVLPMSIQDWYPLGFTGLISLLSKGLSRVFSSTTVWKHQFFGTLPFYDPTLMSIHAYWKNSFD